MSFSDGGGGGEGRGLMRPGPVFILTFLPQRYRCPSSDFKGRYGLVCLPQRSQPHQLLCSRWHFHPNGKQPAHPCRMHTRPSVPISTWCPPAERTGTSVMKVSAQHTGSITLFVRGGKIWYFPFPTKRKQAIIGHRAYSVKWQQQKFRRIFFLKLVASLQHRGTKMPLELCKELWVCLNKIFTVG